MSNKPLGPVSSREGEDFHENRESPIESQLECHLDEAVGAEIAGLDKIFSISPINIQRYFQVVNERLQLHFRALNIEINLCSI